MVRSCVAALVVLASFAATARSQSTWFVDDDAPAGGDGTSWSSAFQFLQDALAVAQPGDAVHLAGGEYRPDLGGGETAGDRTATFDLAAVTLVGAYRGLASGGSADDRDLALFPSVLTGDLAQDDPSLADNSRRLVMLFGDAELDGVVLEATADGTYNGIGLDAQGHALTARDCEFRDHAGGASQSGDFTLERCWFHHNRYAIAGADVDAVDCAFEDHTVRAIDLFRYLTFHATRCAFRRNTTSNVGAAILAYTCDVTLDDCVVEDNVCNGVPYEGGGAITIFEGGVFRLHRTRCSRNKARERGGAVSVWSPDDTITIEVEGCLFEGNHSDTYSGALDLDTSMPETLVDCRFVGNDATLSGGALGAWLGAMTRCAFVGNSSPKGIGAVGVATYGWDMAIVDCTFEGNSGSNVGALRIGAIAGDQVRFERCTVADNHVASTGPALLAAVASSQSLHVADSILFDNDRAGTEDEAAQLTGPAGAITIDRSCVEGWTGALGGSGNFGSDPLFVDPATGRYDLQLGSPCVEAGDAAYVPAAGFERDVAGNGRVLDAQLDRSPRLDLGAYEFAHAHLSVTGSATPGGSLTLTLDGTPGLPALLFLGFGESALRVGPLGYLFVDLGAPYLLLPWSAAPSQVTASLPSDTPVPLTFFLEAAVFQAPSGNFSNVVRVDVR